MPKNSPKQPSQEPEKDRVSSNHQKTFYCDPDLWVKVQTFIDASQIATKGKTGPKPPKSTSALIVDLLAKHLGKNGPKVGVRLPEKFLKKS